MLVGCVLLAFSANRFVVGASAIAANFGVPPLIIGVVLVGFATSAPEMLVSGLAAWQGNPSIGIGTALGSSIANIGLVLGVTALIRPLAIHSKLLKREFPVLLIAMLFAWWLMIDGHLGRKDAVFLLIAIMLILLWMLRIAMKAQKTHDPLESEIHRKKTIKISNKLALFWFLIGLALLLVSSRILIYGAVNIAHVLGISELVIGLTVIAIGTSLPELAASVASVLRKEDDIALGNLIGSNIFNILAVLAMPGLIHPSTVSNAVLWRDFPIVFILSILLAGMAYGFRKPGGINRTKGAVLLISYIAYLIYLYAHLV